MQNDPSAPNAPPSKGFASLLSLVSDVSQDLAALEQAAAEPPPPAPPPRPEPVRIAPAPVPVGPYVAVAPLPGMYPVGAQTPAVPRYDAVASRAAARTPVAAPAPKPAKEDGSMGSTFWIWMLILAALGAVPCILVSQRSHEADPAQPPSAPSRQRPENGGPLPTFKQRN